MNIMVLSCQLEAYQRIFQIGYTLIICCTYLPLELSLHSIMVEQGLTTLKRGWIGLFVTSLGLMLVSTLLIPHRLKQGMIIIL